MNARRPGPAPPVALALALALALAGCQPPAGPNAASPSTTTPAASTPGDTEEALEGQLNVVAWPGHFERGATDAGYDWVTPFEKGTGCQVSVRIAGSSEEMAALMAQGGHDLVTASGDVSLQMVHAGVVQALDLERIPSYANVDERLRQAPWHFVDGRHYGVPWQWAPNVLMYATKAFPVAPGSWSVVFEERRLPDGRSNAGRVQAYAGAIYVADAALYLMAARPDLGIDDPYALDETQYAAVLALLRQQRPLVQRYWQDANVAVQDFTSAVVVVSGSWPFQVNTLRANGQPVASLVPAEGATGRADTTMIATKSQHPNCAYKWLEWSLNAKVQGDAAAWTGAVPAVPAACEDNDLLGVAGCARNGFGQFDRIRFWRTPEAACTQGACVPWERWIADYAAIREGR